MPTVSGTLYMEMMFVEVFERLDLDVPVDSICDRPYE